MIKDKKAFIFIDLTPYPESFAEIINYPFLIPYFETKLACIEKTLKYCQENNIDIININYLENRYGSSKLFEKYDVIKVPNFNQYNQLFFGGMSLDECVTVSRPYSYNNLKHINKTIVLDCCIQGTFKNRKQTKHLKNKQDFINYELWYLQTRKFNYISSLII